MKLSILSILITFSTICSLSAQATIVLQPGVEGKDNQVYDNTPNTNYVSDLLRALTWTFSGNPGIIRSFLQFDLSSIPSGSTIDSAYLYLYSPNAPTTEFHSGENAAYLRRVTSDWGETTITWNNQPSYTIQNEVELPKSTAQFQDYGHINVTNLLTDMIHNQSSSFGFVMMLQNEVILRRLSFASSDYPDATKHPKLVVHYTAPECTTLVIRQDGSGQDNQVFSLQPSSNYVSDLFRGMSWTFQGSPGIIRGLLQFDLSSIPVNSHVVFAYLSLYSPDAPTTEFHSGNNAAFLQRITSDWSESTVTWNNQPSTTALHQVSLPESTSDYQDYLNINVTSLVDDMLANPANSYGFLLRQQTEEGLRRLSFVSGDYPNTAKQPKLEVCYNASTAIKEVNKANLAINVYPNPAGDFIQIGFDKSIGNAKLEIMDLSGKILFQKQIDANEKIDISSLPSSVYDLRILANDNALHATAKFIKQ